MLVSEVFESRCTSGWLLKKSVQTDRKSCLYYLKNILGNRMKQFRTVNERRKKEYHPRITQERSRTFFCKYQLRKR